MNRALFENHCLMISAIERPVWCLWPAAAAENQGAAASNAFNATFATILTDTSARGQLVSVRIES